MSNSEQIDFWNGPHGEAWAHHSVRIDAMFRPLTEALLDAAAPRPGERALDLGCGGGGTALALADRVAPDGTVVAVDVSAPMIRLAQQRFRAAGHGHATALLGDASACPFERTSFDILVSRLGCMFFDDPAATFAALRPALRPGARIALGVWRAPRDNPWAMVPVSAARDFIDMPPRPGPEDPGAFSFAREDRVRRILDDAGFADVTLTPFDFPIPLGADVDEALEFSMEMGPLSGPLSDAAGDARDRAVAAVRAALAGRADGSGAVHLGGGCWIVTARVP